MLPALYECQLSATLKALGYQSDGLLARYTPADPLSAHTLQKAKQAYLINYGFRLEFNTATTDSAAQDEVPLPVIKTGLEKADLSLARTWLAYCRKHHKSTCKARSIGVFTGLKAIDCVSGRVCHATAGQLYVALSYVWGPPPTQDQQDLKRRFQPYPKVIEDAVLVARRLEGPYL